jgi:hypothetical protein
LSWWFAYLCVMWIFFLFNDYIWSIIILYIFNKFL